MPTLANSLPTADLATPIPVIRSNALDKFVLRSFITATSTPIYAAFRLARRLQMTDQTRTLNEQWRQWFAPTVTDQDLSQEIHVVVSRPRTVTPLQREVARVLEVTGWSQHTLANAIQISQPSVGDWARGVTEGSSRSHRQQQSLHAITEAIERVHAIAGSDAVLKQVLARSGALELLRQGRLGSAVGIALDFLRDADRHPLISSPVDRKRPAAVIPFERLVDEPTDE